MCLVVKGTGCGAGLPPKVMPEETLYSNRARQIIQFETSTDIKI